MLEVDLLRRAFHVFDQDGKGFIAMSDLQRVLRSFGRSSVDAGWMQGATDGDREGRRVTYGSYVRLMTHTVKQTLDAGDVIFAQGDPVRFFYCLLEGEVEVVRRDPSSGRLDVLNTLHAGEYFGENSLLEGAQQRSVTIRCATPVQVLKLSKDDFEAGFAAGGGGVGDGGGSGGVGDGSGRGVGELARSASSAEKELRSKLISFIRMVSNQEQRTLRRGEPVFSSGNVADKFFILSTGELEVWAGQSATPGGVDGARDAADVKPLGTIHPGEGFGESALLRQRGGLSADAPTQPLQPQPLCRHTKTVTCNAARCEIVEILGADFLRLLEKSRVVRESFERLSVRRNQLNEDWATRERSSEK